MSVVLVSSVAHGGWNNGRFYWIVLHWICSCYCCLAINWQATVLATGLAFLPVGVQCLLGAALILLLAALLVTSACCACEHFGDSHGKVPGLEGGQGNLCSCTGQDGTPVWTWVQGTVTHGGVHCGAQNHWQPMENPMLQQVDVQRHMRPHQKPVLDQAPGMTSGPMEGLHSGAVLEVLWPVWEGHTLEKLKTASVYSGFWLVWRFDLNFLFF